jgi:hypothetical protein
MGRDDCRLDCKDKRSAYQIFVRALAGEFVVLIGEIGQAMPSFVVEICEIIP